MVYIPNKYIINFSFNLSEIAKIKNYYIYGKTMEFPKISVIVPIPPKGNYGMTYNSIINMDYPKDKIEFIVSRGRHRSQQRNKAINEATGDILFFYDNDIIAEKDAFKQVVKFYNQDKKIACVGGPCLTAKKDSFLQKCFGYVFGSYFAMASMRAKFLPKGDKPIKATEKELILCNLSFRANVVKEVGGFNPNLHSGNEENELMNKIQAKDYDLIYNPNLKTYRSRRKNIIDLSKQIAKYGKGRIEHLFLRPKSFSSIFLMPVLLVLYLISIPILFLFSPFLLSLLYLFPLGLYIIFALASTLKIYLKHKNLRLFLVIPFLFPIIHISYALGMVNGLIKKFSKTKRKIGEIKIEKKILKDEL